MEKAKHVTWRLLAVGVCLLTVSSVARADSLDEQRSRYAQIKQAWARIACYGMMVEVLPASVG